MSIRRYKPALPLAPQVISALGNWLAEASYRMVSRL
jgi:hypothetical protein